MHLLDAGVVNEPGIGTGASDDELGPEQLGRQLHLVVVYESCCSLERERERQIENRQEAEQEERIKRKWRRNMRILKQE